VPPDRDASASSLSRASIPGDVGPAADENLVRIGKRWFETQGYTVETWRHEGRWIARARLGKLGDELIGRGETEAAAMHELQGAYQPANRPHRSNPEAPSTMAARRLMAPEPRSS
jgi:hypothetical protein